MSPIPSQRSASASNPKRNAWTMLTCILGLKRLMGAAGPRARSRDQIIPIHVVVRCTAVQDINLSLSASTRIRF